MEVGTNVACNTREEEGNEEEIKGPAQIESRGVRRLDILTQNASNREFQSTSLGWEGIVMWAPVCWIYWFFFFVSVFLDKKEKNHEKLKLKDSTQKYNIHLQLCESKNMKTRGTNGKTASVWGAI